MTCRSKIAKIVPIGIQDGHHGVSLEDLFFVSSPESKGKLTRNLVRSIGVTYKFTSPESKSQLIQNLVGCIGVTCRSKVAKIPPIVYPRWPPWQPFSKSIFGFF